MSIYDQVEAETAHHDAVRPAAASPTVAATPTLATDRQVDYILTLLARRSCEGEGGGYFTGPTTRTEIAAMTRHAASSYIDSLTGRY